MAIAGKTLRDIVKPDRLEEYDRRLHWYLEDPERFPGLVRHPCIMKLEMQYADEMVCLNSKMYIAHAGATQDRKEVIKKASKGLQHSNPVGADVFRSVLETQKPHTGANHGFRMIDGRIYQYSQRRTALTYFYCKRILHEDGVSTSPLQLSG